MRNKKIKVFLGGYINSINAQNLNCRSLAKHLNKEKFNIGALIYPGGTLKLGKDFDHVKKFSLLLPLYRPLSFLRYIAYLRGLLWCDVAYLPKGEIFPFVQRIAKLFKKKTFITVEGVIDKETYSGLLNVYRSDELIRQLYNGYDRTYSITKYMSEENKRLLNIISDGVLYLGVETETFKSSHRRLSSSLSKIIFIGTDLQRKRVDEYINLSKVFPEIEFHIVGGNDQFTKKLHNKGFNNIICHGRLTHNELSQLLSAMDLHIFPSRSEGFPKVTLETAAAGVPSIVYNDYGADEWITTGVDGFVVKSFDEIVKIVSFLHTNPDELLALSSNAVKMSSRFDWKNTIKDWESAIERLFKEKRK